MPCFQSQTAPVECSDCLNFNGFLSIQIPDTSSKADRFSDKMYFYKVLVIILTSPVFYDDDNDDDDDGIGSGKCELI